MKQTTFLNINILHEVDNTTDGVDLKRIARGDDGRDYACKRIDDAPLLPITEWFCYHLWMACGLKVPDFAVLNYRDGRAPAFGSRWESASAQLPKDATSFDILAGLKPHKSVLEKTYPLDAFVINTDRHGRNFLMRQSITGAELVSIDYSQAWVLTGLPFGDESKLTANCQTGVWWSYLKNNLRLNYNDSAMRAALALPNDWATNTINKAPKEWASTIDLNAVGDYWKNTRSKRGAFVLKWL